MFLLIHLISFLSGGFWKLKERCTTTRFGPLRTFYLRVYQVYNVLYGSSIAYNSKFAGTPCMPHGFHGVFISGGASIGRDVVIFQQVTVGSVTIPGSGGFGSPTIGDNCYLGAGARVLGNIVVGDNVRIGANSVVFEDIPDNSVVVPGSVSIRYGVQGLNNRMYSFRHKWCYFENGDWVEETRPEVLKKMVVKKRRVRAAEE